MRFGAIWIGLAIALIYLGSVLGDPGWLLIWPAASLGVVGVAYLIGWSGAFGKRSDGRISPVARLFHFPYLAITNAVWLASHRLGRDDGFDLVTEGLTVGRRLRAHEYPDGIQTVVDLTAEFEEPQSVVESHHYLALPVLDAEAPGPESILAMVQQIGPGAVYVHCAYGRGRAALFATCYLLHRDAAPTAEEAFALLKSRRPVVRMTPSQWRCAKAFQQLRHADP